MSNDNKDFCDFINFLSKLIPILTGCDCNK